MLEFFISNIFVSFGWHVFQQTVGIRLGTNCAPLLVDLFLYYYETDFIQKFLRKKDKKLAISLHFNFRYKDDVLSLNNSKFGDYVERIYSIEQEIKGTTDTVKSASFCLFWICIYKLTMRVGWKQNFTLKEMISAFQL